MGILHSTVETDNHDYVGEVQITTTGTFKEPSPVFQALRFALEIGVGLVLGLGAGLESCESCRMWRVYDSMIQILPTSWLSLPLLCSSSR